MACEVRTTCPYCGVGCGIIATRDDAGTVTVKGDPEHPANYGRLCSKGSALGETLDHEDRLLFPQIDDRQASWEEALDLVAERFSRTIAEYGPGSVAFYVSGQLLTEDYYIANKLMKGFIGSANIDTNSRLCMSSSVAGHRRAFGSDTVPGVYEDIELADLVVLTGSNLAWCHPVLFQRLAAVKAARPTMKVVVIDPRRTMTCDIADLHLQIRPDGDVALFLGLLAHLARSGGRNETYISAYTQGIDEALNAACSIDELALSDASGLRIEDIRAFYHLFASTEKTVTCYSQGVNQSVCGTDKVNAIINCHLATGRIGRPGMGPFSLTGQPNAMGGREVGGLANMLAAHMEIENETHRARVQRFWSSPRIAEKPGLKAVELFEAMAEGRIKAVWIMATNPAVSLPQADKVKAALEICPFVVVSDLTARTDTAKLAHVLLPSLGWGEKDGTITNSERRISRQRAFLPAPGEARADWWQLSEVAKRLGFAGAFSYQSPVDIFREHAALSGHENAGTRDFDLSGLIDITADGYADLSPVQWPVVEGGRRDAIRFFGKGGFFHADGKARFVAVLPPSPRSDRPYYPLNLNTGRIRDQWHTMTRTGKSPRLSAHIAEPFAEVHPQDAADIGLIEADLIEIRSPHGRAIVRALITPRQARGNLFVPMHWNDEFAAEARIGALIEAVTDPVSGQPASKKTAVAARRFEASWYGFAICTERPSTISADYWAIAKTDGGYRIECAFTATERDWLHWSRETFAIPEDVEPLRYADNVSGQERLAFFDGTRLLVAVFLAREPVAVARNWAVAQLSTDHEDTRRRFALIAGRPGGDRPDPGAIICSCMSVGINEIVAAVRNGCRDAETVGHRTKAGTNCGSCRAEIRGIIDGCLVAAAE
ncbi:nitrate reductase [Oryzifoliimicrobium ureilyticus]|uniref:nitrate reductase n=1 Tax=Oryzifoliimicrobium ureilyticus TaxID=3113724 RepID=UPI003075F6DA